MVITVRITFAPTIQKAGEPAHEGTFFKDIEKIEWPNATDRINRITVHAGDHIVHEFNWLHVRDVEIDGVGLTRPTMTM